MYPCIDGGKNFSTSIFTVCDLATKLLLTAFVTYNTMFKKGFDELFFVVMKLVYNGLILSYVYITPATCRLNFYRINSRVIGYVQAPTSV